MITVVIDSRCRKLLFFNFKLFLLKFFYFQEKLHLFRFVLKNTNDNIHFEKLKIFFFALLF